MLSRVAESLREDTRRQNEAMSPAARVALARRLGDEDAARYAAVHGLTVTEARDRLQASRHVGRRPSSASRL